MDFHPPFLGDIVCIYYRVETSIGFNGGVITYKNMAFELGKQYQFWCVDVN
jgi:hypothetical protein